MKNSILQGCRTSYLLIALCCVPHSATLTAEPLPAENPGTLTLNFFNAGDYPPALPYMSITFSNLLDKTAGLELQHEIDTAIRNQGGIVHDEDYIRILEVLPAYIFRLQELGISNVRISFPRKRAGVILYQE